MAFSKFYCYFNEDKDVYEKKLSEYLKIKESHPEIQFVLLLNKQNFDSDDEAKQVLSLAKSFINKGINPHEFIVSVEAFDYRYKTEEWERIKGIEDVFKKKGVAFGFEDMRRTWSIEEVENANNMIVDTADDIRKRKLSSYEKLLDAYMSVCERGYKKEEAGDHFSESRSVYGILNTDKMVCVGYAQLLEALIQEVGDENIKVFLNHVSTSEDNIHRRGLHMNVIVYIKDEKYGLEGYYYLDPTWDSDATAKRSLDYFMIPLKDIRKLKNPYIRNDNYIRPPLKENGEKKTPSSKKVKPSKPDLIYNVRQNRSISFTADSFVFNYVFLCDYLKRFPEDAIELKKLYRFTDTEISSQEKSFEKFETQRQTLDVIKDMLSDVLDKKVGNACSIGVFATIKNAIQLGNLKQIERAKVQILKSIENDNGVVSVGEILDCIEKAIVEKQDLTLYAIQAREDGDVNPESLAMQILNTTISGESKAVEQLILQKSESVGIEKTLMALKSALKSRFKNHPDSQIEQYVHEIIMKTANGRKKILESFDQTDYADYLEEMQKEE